MDPSRRAVLFGAVSAALAAAAPVSVIKAGDVYGASPAMAALPDVERMRRILEQALWKAMNPPLIVYPDGRHKLMDSGPALRTLEAAWELYQKRVKAT